MTAVFPDIRSFSGRVWRVGAIAIGLLAFSVIGGGGAVAADPIEGTWRTGSDTGTSGLATSKAYAHVHIAPCEEALCGTLTRTFGFNGEYQSNNIGKLLLIDFVPDQQGQYSGTLWRASNGKIYPATLRLKKNGKLQLKACLKGTSLCQKQTWKRVD